MRWAYRAALCSPDFLYHVEPAGQAGRPRPGLPALLFLLELACPTSALTQLAAAGKLHEPNVLDAEVERLLQGPEVAALHRGLPRPMAEAAADRRQRSRRKLYPEFSPYLQDSMVAETRAYFRELIDKNLDASLPGEVGLRDAQREAGGRITASRA